MKMTKRKPPAAVFAFALLAACVLALASCGRDPIFFTISTEVPPREPLVPGGPTKMVVFDWATPGDGPARPVLFVASGSLFWYAPAYYVDGGHGNRRWDNTSARWGTNIGVSRPPGERIIDIAATQNYLYALTGTGTNNVVRRIRSGGDGGWQATALTGNIQSIFGEPEGTRLFAGVRTGGRNHEIRFLDENGANGRLPTEGEDTGLLSGAAGGFLSTTGRTLPDGTDMGGGIFYAYTGARVPGSEGRMFMGMIALPNGTVIAVTRAGGFLYEVSAASAARIPRTGGEETAATEMMQSGRDATGALALWDETDDEGNINPERRMLIVGIQGSRHATTFVNGYVEFSLTADGALDTARPRRDAGDLLTVHDNPRYRTSIGRLPLNHLFQVPFEIDSDATFFASTQTVGLWSYRFRQGEGGWQWNAED